MKLCLLLSVAALLSGKVYSFCSTESSLDDDLFCRITDRMDKLDTANEALKQKIEEIKQENQQLLQDQEVLLQWKHASLVREELVNNKRKLLGRRDLKVEPLVTLKEFQTYQKWVNTSITAVTENVTSTTTATGNVANFTDALEVEVDETSTSVENVLDVVSDICRALTSLNCTPEIVFASMGQAVCDIENKYYSKGIAAPLCQGSFPTVISLAGLELCAPDIATVEFSLKRPDGSTWEWTDTTWPYSVFNDTGGIYEGEVLPTGSYSLNFSIYSSRAPCTLLSSNVSFQVNGTNCSQDVDLPRRYPINGHLYSYDTVLTTWNNAKIVAQNARCCGIQGHLPTIADALENDFVRSIADSSLWFYLGLTDGGSAAGNFKWITNEPLTYVNWYPGEPSGGNYPSCVIMLTDGRWDDIRCTAVGNFLTSYEWDCPSLP